MALPIQWIVIRACLTVEISAAVAHTAISSLLPEPSIIIAVFILRWRERWPYNKLKPSKYVTLVFCLFNNSADSCSSRLYRDSQQRSRYCPYSFLHFSSCVVYYAGRRTVPAEEKINSAWLQKPDAFPCPGTERIGVDKPQGYFHTAFFVANFF